jgi:hypothetical protein
MESKDFTWTVNKITFLGKEGEGVDMIYPRSSSQLIILIVVFVISGLIFYLAYVML